MRWKAVWIVAGLAWLVAGCTEKSGQSARERGERVTQLIAQTPPQPQHPLDFSFEGKVRLVGYDVNKASVAPGGSFEVTWYWKVDSKLEPGWRQFTHQADATAVGRINLDEQGALRRGYRADAWQAGEYLMDPQTVKVPNDWGSGAVQLYLGFWQGSRRLQVIEGAHDGTHRVLGLSLPVQTAETTTPTPDVPVLVAGSREGELRMDGRLDEPDWQRAATTGRLVHTMTGEPADPATTVRVLFDDSHLYLAFEVADRELRSEFRKHDDHLWEQDAIEVMLDPTGDGRNYFEVQVSPRGLVFDTRYDTRRQPRPFGHVDWTSQAKVGVQLRGEVDDDRPDQGYTIEVALPWQAFSTGAEAIPRPALGESWRVNFYVMDAYVTRGKIAQRAVAWSPPKVGDFHVPGRFARVQFGTVASEILASDTVPSETTASEPPAVAPSANSAPDVP